MNISTDVIDSIVNHHHSEFVYIKDEYSRYIYVNDNVLSFYNLTDLDQIYYKTDHEIYWHKYAKQYMDNDAQAITLGKFQAIEPTVTLDGGEAFILSNKYGFRDAKTKQYVMLGISKVIGENAMQLLLPSIYGQHQDKLNEESYLFNQIVNEHAETKLTEKELDILYYTLHGLSQKQVADKIKLSVRTVEDYINHIKIKLRCFNKYQLFEFALRHGLMNIIPRHSKAG